MSAGLGAGGYAARMKRFNAVLQTTYPAHGWLPPGAPLNFQRDDQGRDFVTAWRGAIQAPGSWECKNVLHDNPFPNGFGPNYAVVFIKDGAFGGHGFYLGHCTTAVSQGQSGGFGDVLAHADQGQNFEATNGGWVELGEAFYNSDDGLWLPGPVSGRKWFDPLLEQPLVVTHDPHNYLWYPPAVSILGRVWNERYVVMRYDELRAQQTKTKHPHRPELALLRSHAKLLAGRVWTVAHMRKPAAWNDNRHLGFRYQGLIQRSQGERLV